MVAAIAELAVTVGTRSPDGTIGFEEQAVSIRIPLACRDRFYAGHHLHGVGCLVECQVGLTDPELTPVIGARGPDRSIRLQKQTVSITGGYCLHTSHHLHRRGLVIVGSVAELASPVVATGPDAAIGL